MGKFYLLTISQVEMHPGMSAIERPHPVLYDEDSHIAVYIPDISRDGYKLIKDIAGIENLMRGGIEALRELGSRNLPVIKNFEKRELDGDYSSLRRSMVALRGAENVLTLIKSDLKKYCLDAKLVQEDLA